MHWSSTPHELAADFPHDTIEYRSTPSPRTAFIIAYFSSTFLEGKLRGQTAVMSAVIVFMLTACGGGSDSSSQIVSAVYRFATPALGSKAVISETLIDNLNNTI